LEKAFIQRCGKVKEDTIVRHPHHAQNNGVLAVEV
jgi:hypothetical protein